MVSNPGLSSPHRTTLVNRRQEPTLFCLPFKLTRLCVMGRARVASYFLLGIVVPAMLAALFMSGSGHVGNVARASGMEMPTFRIPSALALMAQRGSLGSPPPVPLIEAPRSEGTFTYPFPNRKHLFLPPARKSTVMNRESPTDGNVVLLGFAKTGEDVVILRIDGVIATLRAGESWGDLRVLGIDPPEVRLQRRNVTWVVDLAKEP